jgi:signal transduction protein with GAF and PtsI domain
MIDPVAELHALLASDKLVGLTAKTAVAHKPEASVRASANAVIADLRKEASRLASAVDQKVAAVRHMLELVKKVC